jgi:hypothetical protein
MYKITILILVPFLVKAQVFKPFIQTNIGLKNTISNNTDYFISDIVGHYLTLSPTYDFRISAGVKIKNKFSLRLDYSNYYLNPKHTLKNVHLEAGPIKHKGLFIKSFWHGLDLNMEYNLWQKNKWQISSDLGFGLSIAQHTNEIFNNYKIDSFSHSHSESGKVYYIIYSAVYPPLAIFHVNFGLSAKYTIQKNIELLFSIPMTFSIGNPYQTTMVHDITLPLYRFHTNTSSNKGDSFGFNVGVRYLIPLKKSQKKQ